MEKWLVGKLPNAEFYSVDDRGNVVDISWSANPWVWVYEFDKKRGVMSE